jgi:type I restriction enzyme S subunit
MKYGLSDKQLQEIKEILASYESVDKAVLFGSRAIDTYKEASDVDIAIKGEQADWSLAITIKEHLEEETYLPFFFDVVAYGSVESEELKQHIDGKGKVLFERGVSEWREYKLGDIGTFSYGKMPKKDLLNTGDFPTFSGYKYQYTYPESNCNKNDLIVVARGVGGTGDVKIVREDCYLTNLSLKMDFDSEIAVDKFVYYFYSIETLRYLDSDSAQSQITITDLSNAYIPLPPLPEQKAIAEVLSSLDDKIDLLHRQNKTLEQMAETLFRQWFVEEAGEDWEEVPLSYFGKIICGKTPSKKKPEFYNGDIPFIKIPDMHRNTYIFHTADTLTMEGSNSQKNKLLPPESICVSCIATVGLVSMNIVESQTNQQINSIIPSKDVYRYFLYLYMKASYDELHAMASGGTATLNLNTGSFSKTEVIKPNLNILEKFHNMVETKFNKIFSNQKQIRTLQSLRDTLLPKLMSGEVRIASNG